MAVYIVYFGLYFFIKRTYCPRHLCHTSVYLTVVYCSCGDLQMNFMCNTDYIVHIITAVPLCSVYLSLCGAASAIL